MKQVIIHVIVTVVSSVDDDVVFQQIHDAVDPDSWNWNIDVDLIGHQEVSG